MAFSIPNAGFELSKENLVNVPFIQVNNDTSKDTVNQSDSVEYRAAMIDSYFASKGLPLAGYGKKIVVESDLNKIDWRLLAGIAMRESTGGKFGCGNNYFGWHSCKVHFKSVDQAIEVLAKHLGGNNPQTAHFYAGKDTKGILNTYNPPSVVAEYTNQVIRIMDDISNNA